MQHEALKHRLDAHLHLKSIPRNTCFSELPGRDIIKLFLERGSKSICNGTSPLDWNLLADLAELYPKEIIPFYGVHPWYVDALPENWLENLRFMLASTGYGIGEIGLDRAHSSKADFTHQKSVFIDQLDLALSLDLPVAVHCVRAWGILLEILQEKLLIKIGNNKYCRIPVMIHSFNGSLEIMKQLTDMSVFISVSPYLLSVRAEYLREIIKETPLERILVESDFSYSKNIPVINQITDYYRNLTSLYSLAGSLKGLEPEIFQEVVFKNGKIFTNRALNRH